ncbi:MAG: hypothetical protein O7H41_15960 [Planctomycetota bacterium]|nr:hypothetical protein [Planctomycetota bacterium]
MDVRIHGSPKGNNLHDLWVGNDKAIEGESYAIVSQVWDALMGMGNPGGEAREIADAIRQKF